MVLHNEFANEIFLSVNNDWIEGAGRAIGDSTLLEHLEIIITTSGGGGDEWLVELCQGLSCNQSISMLSLSVGGCSSTKFDIFQLLTPFLERSPKLSCIHVHGYDTTSQMMHTLPSALSKWGNEERKSFFLNNSNLDDDEGAALFRVLCRVHNLVTLHVQDTSLGQRMLRMTSSSDLIEIPSSQLCEIWLYNCQLGDQTSKVLMDALKSNKELVHFKYGGNSSLSASWLRSTLPFCSISELDLSGTSVSDEIAACLGDALAWNKSVQMLDLNYNESITAAGWEGFGTCLRSPNTSLIDLRIDYCNIDSNGAVAIALALRENTILQDLTMGENPMMGTMTSGQWHAFVQFLRSPQSALKNFLIEKCNIGDEGAVATASALADNRSLVQVSLHGNRDITSVGLLAYFHLLLDTQTSLEELVIDLNRVDPGMITEEEWGILSTALCNTATIDSTFSSKHTFHHLWMERNYDTDPIGDELLTSDEFPPDQYPPYSIYYMLRMNRNPNKVEVARQKILMHHFSSSGSDVDVFASMSKNVLPHAIEWIGRDKQCYSLMFDFARAFPFLFTPPCLECER